MGRISGERCPLRPPPELEPEDQSTGPSTCLPASDPADSLIQTAPDLGIPIDSFRSDAALVIEAGLPWAFAKAGKIGVRL
jgi:hypothetical protein